MKRFFVVTLLVLSLVIFTSATASAASVPSSSVKPSSSGCFLSLSPVGAQTIGSGSDTAQMVVYLGTFQRYASGCPYWVWYATVTPQNSSAATSVSILIDGITRSASNAAGASSTYGGVVGITSQVDPAYVCGSVDGASYCNIYTGS